MDVCSEKYDLKVDKSDLKYIFKKLHDANLLTEAEYKKAIERLNSYMIKEGLY